MEFIKAKISKISIIVIAFSVFAAAGIYFWQVSSLDADRETAVIAPQSNKSDTTPSSYHPTLSLQAFSQKEFSGHDLTLGPVLAQNSQYTRYYITYKSSSAETSAQADKDLTISGIMNVPVGDGPFPVLILNHGYIDPAVYTNGRGLKREQDYFARNGFVVIHPDYRNHADSTKVDNVEERFRLGYAEDVINAVYAVRESDMDIFAKDRIGMLGHSMGGGVALVVMTTHPDLVEAYSLYAPVSADTYDNFNKWTREREETAQKIIAEHGLPADNPEFWHNISPINFIGNITAPVILHHGTADDSVPIEWSDRFARAMEQENKDITYHTYPNGAHEFGPHWNTFMRRNVEFFNKYLK